MYVHSAISKYIAGLQVVRGDVEIETGWVSLGYLQSGSYCGPFLGGWDPLSSTCGRLGCGLQDVGKLLGMLDLTFCSNIVGFINTDFSTLFSC